MIAAPDLRQCRDCGAWMPLDEHHFAPSGKRFRSACRRCQSDRATERARRLRHDPATRADYLARRAATARRYNAKHRDKKNEWCRASYARVYSDPEKRSRRQAMNRANYRRRRNFGRQWWDEPDYEETYGLVDARPFLTWVAAQYPNVGYNELARLFSMDGSNARRIFHERQPRISIAVIDRALTVGLSRPDLLEVLYPYEEASS